MAQISPATLAAQTPLTSDQQKALKNLHSAATQFEGVFLQMVMDAMRSTVPENTLFGQDSASEGTWQSMLDNEYAQNLSKTGGVGLAKQMERQMRNAVLSNAKAEANADPDATKRIGP